MANSKTKTKTCFVIMPFHRNQSLQEVYEISIKPAVELSGFRCIRADEIPGAGLILESILNAAYEADIVIADITGNNANVMYELGLAHGFVKPVIMLSQDISAAPFDLKTYHIIVYKPQSFGSAEKLMKEIRGALEATSSAPEKESRNPVRLFIPNVVTSTEAGELRKRMKELEDENKRLEGTRELAQAIINRLGADQKLEQIQQEIEGAGRRHRFRHGRPASWRRGPFPTHV